MCTAGLDSTCIIHDVDTCTYIRISKHCNIRDMHVCITEVRRVETL